MGNRGALLFTTGDPVVASTWLSSYQIWKDKIDTLYVSIASFLSQELKEVTAQLFNLPNVVVYINTPTITKTGIRVFSPIINNALLNTKEDNLVFLEDDGIIKDRNLLDYTFGLLESGIADIVGSKRNCCSPILSERAANLWGLNYEGYGDQGMAIWPFLFHFRKQDVLKHTNLNWDGFQWPIGTYIKSLDITLTEDTGGDALVDMSLQLRAAGLNFSHIPQNHLYLEHTKTDFDMFKWFHIGSLSTVATLLEKNDKPNQTFLSNIDVIRRLSIYSYMLGKYKPQCILTQQYYTKAQNIIDYIFRNTLIDQELIHRLATDYSSLFNPLQV